MGFSDGPLLRLVREVHRRSLWQVLAIYAAASWAVLEVADVLIERLSLPEWIYGLALILLLIGLPIVIGTAFIQEGVPERRRDEGAGRSADAAGAGPSIPDAPASRPLSGGAGGAAAGGAGRVFTWRNAALGGIGATALWAVVAGGWLLFGAGMGTAADGADGGRAARAAEVSVAVLPFTNMSADPDNEYFSDGITEELLNALAQIPHLRVPGRTSSFTFKDTDLRISEIAEILGVSHVLEGSVRKSGDRVRITAQLIEARGDQHLWSETYDRRLEDVFAVQTEIARAITDALQIRLGGEEESRLADGGTDVPEAHDSYLRGRYFWNQRTAQSLRRAAEHFEHAIERDPAYAEAWSGLADTYSVMSFYAYMDTVRIDHRDLRARALEAARRAVELGPGMAMTRTSLAYALFYDGRWEEAEREFRRAIELNPGYATAHHWFGEFLVQTGRPEPAVVHSRRAVELDPISKIVNRDLAQTLRGAGRLDEALEQVRRTVELDPSWPHARGLRATILMDAGRYDEALEAALEGARATGADTTGLRAIHACLVRSRRTGEPQRCEPAAQSPRDFFEQGRADEGVRALERWVEDGNYDSRTISLLHADWGDSDLLRDDARYRALMERLDITW